MDCSPPDSCVYGNFQARILEWVAFSFSRGLPDSGITPISPASPGRFFTTEPPEKPSNSAGESLKMCSFHQISHFAPSTASQNSWDLKVCSKDIFTKQWRELGMEWGGRISNRESRSVSPRQGYWGIYGLRNKAVGWSEVWRARAVWGKAIGK